MRMPRLISAAAPAALLVLLAGCLDTPSTPSVQPDASSPGLQTGFIEVEGDVWEVQYEVRNGRAIFEGDIDLGPAGSIAPTREALRTRRAGGPSQAVVHNNGYRRWPGGVVPYVIEGNVANPYVQSAMSHIQGSVVNVTFVPRTSQANYIIFRRTTDPNICGQSQVGRVGNGAQLVEIKDNATQRCVIHELGHALGQWHEQARCDRDSYIQIYWNNVMDGYASQFNKRCGVTNDGLDVGGYDEYSVMHYHTTAFGKTVNGVKLQTINSLRGLNAYLGTGSGLSAGDVAAINAMYPQPPPYFTSISFPDGTPHFTWTPRVGATSYSVWFIRPEEHFDDNNNPMPYHTEYLVGTTTGTSINDPQQYWSGQSYCFLSGTSREWRSVIATTMYVVQAHFPSGTTQDQPVLVDVCQGPPAY